MADALTITATQQDVPTDYQFTVTAPGFAAATVDFGDGTAPAPVTLTSGVGTVAHTFPFKAGTTVYRVTANAGDQRTYADLPKLAATYADLTDVSATYGGLASRTWADIPKLAATWADVPKTAATWAELAGRASGYIDVTVTLPAVLLAARPNYLPAPVVDVQIFGTSGTWTLTRVNEDTGESVVIYTGPGTSGDTIRDTLAPLNTNLHYLLDQAKSNTVKLAGDKASGCWLTSLVTGETMAVTVQGWPSQSRAPRQSVIPVAGRTDPVIRWDVHLLPSTGIVFRTRDQATYDQITRLLLTVNVLLRTQPASSLPTVSGVVGAFDQARLLTGDGASWLMQHAISLQTMPIDYSRAGVRL